MTVILATERLILRAWTHDDAEALFAICLIVISMRRDVSSRGLWLIKKRTGFVVRLW
jgi:RimJ/RimL family protein N-acetyltransferase